MEVGRFSQWQSPRGLHAGGAGHRRGLVVEVALGVVDASAVALPSSHVIPDVAESDVFVFDPLDSDEEDELDAFSRNATGATQVDREDEPLVCAGRFTPWLHTDSVAGTAINSAQPTVSICEASQASGDASQHPRFTGNRFAALQCEDTKDPLRHLGALVSPANSNISHQGWVAVIFESQRKRMRDRHSQATTVEVCPETVEVLEFDLTRSTRTSQTESLGENQLCTSRQRRLRLTWMEPETVPVNREVRAVSNLFEVWREQWARLRLGRICPEEFARNSGLQATCHCCGLPREGTSQLQCWIGCGKEPIPSMRPYNSRAH